MRDEGEQDRNGHNPRLATWALFDQRFCGGEETSDAWPHEDNRFARPNHDFGRDAMVKSPVADATKAHTKLE